MGEPGFQGQATMTTGDDNALHSSGLAVGIHVHGKHSCSFGMHPPNGWSGPQQLHATWINLVHFVPMFLADGTISCGDCGCTITGLPASSSQECQLPCRTQLGGGRGSHLMCMWLGLPSWGHVTMNQSTTKVLAKPNEYRVLCRPACTQHESAR